MYTRKRGVVKSERIIGRYRSVTVHGSGRISIASSRIGRELKDVSVGDFDEALALCIKTGSDGFFSRHVDLAHVPKRENITFLSISGRISSYGVFENEWSISLFSSPPFFLPPFSFPINNICCTSRSRYQTGQSSYTCTGVEDSFASFCGREKKEERKKGWVVAFDIPFHFPFSELGFHRKLGIVSILSFSFGENDPTAGWVGEIYFTTTR